MPRRIKRHSEPGKIKMKDGYQCITCTECHNTKLLRHFGPEHPHICATCFEPMPMMRASREWRPAAGTPPPITKLTYYTQLSGAAQLAAAMASMYADPDLPATP